MKLGKDRQLGVVCLAICAFIVWECSRITIRKPEFEVVGPRTFPLLAAAIFAVCGFYFLVHKQPEQKKYMTKQQFGRAMLMFGCYVAYLALLYFFGLIVAAPVAMFLMTMLFGKGKITWVRALIYSVVFSAAFYALYVFAFQIRVPKGIL